MSDPQITNDIAGDSTEYAIYWLDITCPFGACIGRVTREGVAHREIFFLPLQENVNHAF